MNLDSPFPGSSRPLLPLRRALLVLLVAGLGFAAVAVADRACIANAAQRTCSEVECLALQANVNAACKNPAPVSCRNLSGCNVLRREKQRWLNCAIARDTINARCWGGGDPGHQQASAQAWQNVGTCEARIALPEPIGCADPCPWIPGFAPVTPSSPTAGESAEEALAIALLSWLGVSEEPPRSTIRRPEQPEPEPAGH